MFDEYSPFTPQLLSRIEFCRQTAELTNMRHYEIIRLSQAGGGRRRARFIGTTRFPGRVSDGLPIF
jgi:hypothetical protein